MKKISECNIVQNLLPNYIDGITDDNLNNYIEEHLKNCEECSKTKENMDDNIIIENESTVKEVKYLKKLKRKVMFIIVLCLLVIFTLLCGLDYYFNYDHPATWKYTNILVYGNHYDYEAHNTYNVLFIFTFDKNEKCTDTRAQLSNLNENLIKDFTDGISRSESEITNVQIHNNTITFNIDMYNGMSKNEITDWANNFKYGIIEL